RSSAARLAVVGELTSLISTAVDMREIFRGAIEKVQRVLDFRRASVVLVDEPATHYYIQTLFDKARGGFVAGEAAFPIAQGMTGEAIRTGRPLRVDALAGTEGILLQEGRRISAMIVPLHVGDRVIGALIFRREEVGHYTGGGGGSERANHPPVSARLVRGSRGAGQPGERAVARCVAARPGRAHVPAAGQLPACCRAGAGQQRLTPRSHCALPRCDSRGR